MQDYGFALKRMNLLFANARQENFSNFLAMTQWHTKATLAFYTLFPLNFSIVALVLELMSLR